MIKVLGLLFYILVSFDMGICEAAMTYDEALKYQVLHSEEVFIRNEKMKDPYGEKNICRYFNLLGEKGVRHNGDFFSNDRSFLNFLINYGFENIPQELFAYFRWAADMDGKPENGYAPKILSISFNDGYIKNLDVQGWEYKRQNLGFGNWTHVYDGRIVVSAVDLYDLYSHGDIMAVYIDKGAGRIKHFFYSGDKDLIEKKKLTRGIANAIKMLQVNEDSLAEQRAILEKERVEKLRKEIEAEIRAEIEKEEIKKAILDEMRNK